MKDGDLAAYDDTYSKYFDTVGGYSTAGFVIFSIIMFKYLDFYSQSVTQSWADAPPEE